MPLKRCRALLQEIENGRTGRQDESSDDGEFLVRKGVTHHAHHIMFRNGHRLRAIASSTTTSSSGRITNLHLSYFPLILIWFLFIPQHLVLQVAAPFLRSLILLFSPSGMLPPLSSMYISSCFVVLPPVTLVLHASISGVVFDLYPYMCISQLVWCDFMICFRDTTTDVESFHLAYSPYTGHDLG